MFDDNLTLNSYNLVLKTDARELLSPTTDLCCSDIRDGLPDDFPGFTIGTMERFDADRLLIYHLWPAPVDDADEHVCPCCHKAVKLKKARSNGHTCITLTDSNKGAYAVKLKIRQKRWVCPHCRRTFVIPPCFKHPCHNITLRLYGAVVDLLDKGIQISAQDVSRLFGINPDIVRAIDKARLQANFKLPDYSNLKYIGLDEHSVERGHSYCTCIFNMQTREMLYICKGKKKADLMPFFQKLGELGLKEQIEAVVCDCASGFINLAKENLPNAVIVIDEFHVVWKLSKVVEDCRRKVAVRMMELAELWKAVYEHGAGSRQADPHFSKLMRLFNMNRTEALESIRDMNPGSYAIMLEKAQSIQRMGWGVAYGLRGLEELESKSRALELIKGEETLNKLAMLVDACKDFWHCSYSPAKVKRYISNWIREAQALGFSKLDSFCRFLEKHTEYIIYASSTGLSNSPVEGLNSVAKAYQRVVRGVKNLPYYMLKLHALFSIDREVTLSPGYCRKNRRRFKDLKKSAAATDAAAA